MSSLFLSTDDRPLTVDDAHDLRNVLAGIISSAECLRRRLTDDAHLRYVDNIIRIARQGAGTLTPDGPPKPQPS